jgi:NTE family protein
VVAAFYASGKTSAQLQRISEMMDESMLTDWTVPLLTRGVMRGDALTKYIDQQLNIKKIEEMKIPLGVVATDLHSGQAILFQRGDVALAVRASSSVPAVFPPVKIGDREYVDGGLVSPVPVRFARQMGADVVQRATRPMGCCKSCSKPSASWAKASTILSSKTPMLL